VGKRGTNEKETARRRVIEVSIALCFGTKRRADLDNFNKLSSDALTGIAYLDDRQPGYIEWSCPFSGLYLSMA
jgi:Holliday junction resolvase RusA-like endonuclease